MDIYTVIVAMLPLSGVQSCLFWSFWGLMLPRRTGSLFLAGVVANIFGVTTDNLKANKALRQYGSWSNRSALNKKGTTWKYLGNPFPSCDAPTPSHPRLSSKSESAACQETLKHEKDHLNKKKIQFICNLSVIIVV